MEVKYCDVCGMIIKNKVEDDDSGYLEKYDERLYTSLADMFTAKRVEKKRKTIEECVKKQIDGLPFDLCDECKKHIYKNYMKWIDERRKATSMLLSK